MSEDSVAMAEVKKDLQHWRENTIEYRNTLDGKIVSICRKIDKIFDKLDLLPCKERGEIYKGLALREKLLWSAIGVIGGLIFLHLGWK